MVERRKECRESEGVEKERGRMRRRKALRKRQAVAACRLVQSCLCLDAPLATSTGLLNTQQRKRNLEEKRYLNPGVLQDSKSSLSGFQEILKK